jgi:hypothetical protein
LAQGLVKRYMSAVAPGNCLVATVASGKGTLAGKFYQTYNESGFATMYNHTPADFASFFGDLAIMPPDLVTRAAQQARLERADPGPQAARQDSGGHRPRAVHAHLNG